ncbi:MAG: Glutathione amide-dependent peroxidase [Alphaproteobacteria bacterium MarineAlpha6_Bin6]|nr:peroxiredoxin [Pelagibacteraceae bacterium]PPR31911.1 MAG: Glutathione amide-dependent peroxidase [Alphaproteobacteria bacterium MarineAlpha6_Bin6]PPR33543.1 MAG: Glutathione amide-dependent peroxidase [Alphaproteobacteria bacterium MarineAlpha6_Bin5]|tara:strand:- start:660 stop:1139 length:480 start_codon:yes stop_codon:yes gene_type:complete
MIKEEETFPNNKVVLVGNDFKEIDTDQFFTGKKVLLFAVPGAYTPTCNNSHLPSFIDKYDEIKEKGIDNIICLSVNDQFVSKAWRDSKSIKDDFLFLADGNGKVTESIGMTLDCSGFGMGNRSNRYVMLIEDKVVKKLILEDNPGVCELTNATEILKSL